MTVWIVAAFGCAAALYGLVGPLFKGERVTGPGRVLIGIGVALGAAHRTLGIPEVVGMTCASLGIVLVLGYGALRQRARGGR